MKNTLSDYFWPHLVCHHRRSSATNGQSATFL